MNKEVERDVKQKIMLELSELEHQLVDVEGQWLRPSQCYYYETDPAHILFNTNCPDNLKEKVLSILRKYIPADESSS